MHESIAAFLWAQHMAREIETRRDHLRDLPDTASTPAPLWRRLTMLLRAAAPHHPDGEAAFRR